MKLSTNPIAMLRAIEQLQARVDALEIAALETKAQSGDLAPLSDKVPDVKAPPHSHSSYKKVAPKRVKKRSEV